MVNVRPISGRQDAIITTANKEDYASVKLTSRIFSSHRDDYTQLEIHVGALPSAWISHEHANMGTGRWHIGAALDGLELISTLSQVSPRQQAEASAAVFTTISAETTGISDIEFVNELVLTPDIVIDSISRITSLFRLHSGFDIKRPPMPITHIKPRSLCIISLARKSTPTLTLFSLLVLTLSASVQARLSPVGYTAAINTPTASTLPWGVASMSWTNNNPERVARFPEQGLFGSFNLGFGLLPGLEVAGRLASDGDTDCNMYVAGCASSMRDVSLSAKYALPLGLPWGARVAVGFSDYGGAATHFRQAYGVLSLPWRDWQASLGYSKPGRDSSRPLMDGPFASVTWQASENWRLALEHDSRDVRGGLWYDHALSPRWQAQVGLSTRFKGRDARQNTQLTVGLQYSLQDHASPAAYVSPRERDQAYWVSAPDVHPKVAAAQLADQAPNTEQALALQQALRAEGFQAVRVGQAPGTWVIEAESQAWRQEPLTAVGVALGAWLRQQPSPRERVHLRTTYMGQTVFTASSSAACARALAGEAQANCLESEQTAWAGAQAALPEPATTWLTPEASALQSLRAEAEVGPALDYTVGTEVGLLDYTLGLEGGWQVSSAWLPGVFWQGHATTPLTRSDDFERDAYFGARDIRQQIQINLLSAVAQPLPQVWLQANWGKISPSYRGTQIDARWLSRDARFGLGASVARYAHVKANDFVYEPQLVNASFSPVPGRWTLRAVGGQFFMGDRGVKISSEHDFGRYQVAMYVRRSGNAGLNLPTRSFAGVQLSLPIGPATAWRSGPLSVRGRDRMSVGFESKVGEEDNIITGGYGLMPVPRHGLNDVLGHASTALPSSSRSARRTVAAAMRSAQP